MSTRIEIVLGLAFVALSGLGGCASSEAGEGGSSGGGGGEELSIEEEEERRKAALVTVRLFVGGAVDYWNSEQRARPEEPWHSGIGQKGDPVPFTKYVFPGGTDVTFRTTDSVPKDGVRYRVDSQLEGADGADVSTLLETLGGIEFPERPYFQYVYKTGPERGPEATATVKARVDFNSSAGGSTTIVRKVASEDGQAYVTDERGNRVRTP